MKTIELTKDYVAVVDDDDYDNLRKYSWCYSHGYAVSYINGKLVRMHRFILDYYGDQDIDHINNNGLDNRKENLRIVSRTINNLNRENVPYNIKQRTLASGKVVFDTRLQVNYVTHHLGTFSTEKRALILVERAIHHLILNHQIHKY